MASALLAVGVLLTLGLAADTVGAAFPGRNGQIAYEDSGEGSEELSSIWTVMPNGRRDRRFSYNASDPSFSADGRRLAFVRGSAIRLVRSDGRGPSRPLTDPPRHFYDESPHWGPHRGRLVFVRVGNTRDRECCTSEIRIYRGHSSRRLKAGGDPAWSSRGRIAFVREGDLYVVRPDGRNLKLVLNGTARSGFVESPDWSPDGRRLVFGLRRSQPDVDTDIATTKPDGTEFRRLTKGFRYDDSAPVFSPDGQAIAFARVGEILPSKLYSMRTHGGKPSPIISGSEYILSLDWQPLRN